MTAREAAPGCWYVEGLSALGSPANQNFISNAGFIVTSAGVVVIDALGSPALAERLLAEIAKVTPQKVTHVVLTHYHADHVYGLQVFERLGARIYAHQAGREYLHADTARLRLEASRKDLAPWIDERTRLVPATEWIDARREITVGDTRLVLQPVGPAHTPEDLAVYVPDKKVLYAGDLVFRSRVPFVGQADSRNWIVSLDKLLAFDAAVVVPGHGPVSTEARKDMQLTRNYLAYLRKTMGQAARDMTPFDEAYKATDWSAYEHLPLFGAANRMNAYNTYLLMEHDPE
ncbi:MBL fold metallo-hydrolase [Ottowia sp.]|uniref:MBL fold metallo-hydrolase n=1 Tax=Ottowia sp. TaxID=1898956 RepID=UPI002C56B855|nr:MBL fold metallo-hydrolase [Ottowia sp.]HOB65251.1 MBL fold metallo-hydrolase [Ottowia sp.]HPZ56187.1 MBL fold metallo-hydrolase [Ottowia sp.]HQD48238.1 MBL fold metallo-hydrolase [Ottowia sp.]